MITRLIIYEDEIRRILAREDLKFSNATTNVWFSQSGTISDAFYRFNCDAFSFSRAVINLTVDRTFTCYFFINVARCRKAL